MSNFIVAYRLHINYCTMYYILLNNQKKNNPKHINGTTEKFSLANFSLVKRIRTNIKLIQSSFHHKIINVDQNYFKIFTFNGLTHKRYHGDQSTQHNTPGSYDVTGITIYE